jgi:hypothetical protein
MDCIFGDIDGDFDLDMLVGNRASNSKLFLNNGGGVFTDVTAARLPANGTTYSWDFGDIDADGDLDALGANSSPASSREALFVNNGNGFFSDMTAARIPGMNNPAVDDNDSKFFDLDNDGDLDFIIASLGSTERICANNGAGNFTLQSGTITAVADSSLDVEVADFNGDGRLDVVTAQGESGSYINRIYINNGPADSLPPMFVDFEMLADITDPAQAAMPYVVRVIIRDGMTSDRGFIAQSVAMVYSANCGAEITTSLAWSGHDLYRGVIPALPDGGAISYRFEATDFTGNSAVSPSHEFMVLTGTPPNGDIVLDGRIDLRDLQAFQTCFSGSSRLMDSYCAAVDVIESCTINLDDFAYLRILITGP